MNKYTLEIVAKFEAPSDNLAKIHLDRLFDVLEQMGVGVDRNQITFEDFDD